MTRILVSILFVSALSLGAADIVAAQNVERYAFITASNEGGAGRERLRYAELDAVSLANVFEEIGGLEARNRIVLLSPSRADFLSGLHRLREKFEQRTQTDVHTQLLFYYSGHSNENGLLLSDGLISYPELRTALDDIRTDVQVAILDSCQAGAFTRSKGGKRPPVFLVDDATHIRGAVLLAASSENEAAQESDKIGGSYFTHFLISALRGAGDISGDKEVTLNEAYYYAFNETLIRTEGSRQGVQHPTHDIQMAGAGDLVLTDVSRNNASLIIPARVTGRIYIRDSSGRLVVEINKIINNDITLALLPGEHQILMNHDGELLTQNVTVSYDAPFVLDADAFSAMNAQKERAREDEPPESGFSIMDRTLTKPNRVSFGYANDFVEYYTPTELYPGEASTDFRGYTLAYRRDMHRDWSIQANFTEARATGVMRSVSVSSLTSLIGDPMNTKNGFRLYGGFGALAYSRYYFPNELKARDRLGEANGDVHVGVLGQIGVQLEYRDLSFDTTAIIRRSNVENLNPLRNGGWPVFSAQMGLRF